MRRRAETAERDAKALAMRIEGSTLAEIAKKLGYSSEQHAWTACERRLKDLPRAHAEEFRRLWTERLELAAKGLMPKAKTGHTFSVDTLVRVADRAAKLTGLDAPQKLDLRLEQYETLGPIELHAKLLETRARIDEQIAALEREHVELRPTARALVVEAIGPAPGCPHDPPHHSGAGCAFNVPTQPPGEHHTTEHDS